MQEPRVGQTGRILHGPNQGWFVKVEDDSTSTGGYLVLLFRSLDPNDKVGFDDWVENDSLLRAYFKRSGWTIEWLQDA